MDIVKNFVKDINEYYKSNLNNPQKIINKEITNKYNIFFSQLSKNEITTIFENALLTEELLLNKHINIETLHILKNYGINFNLKNNKNNCPVFQTVFFYAKSSKELADFISFFINEKISFVDNIDSDNFNAIRYILNMNNNNQHTYIDENVFNILMKEKEIFDYLNEKLFFDKSNLIYEYLPIIYKQTIRHYNSFKINLNNNEQEDLEFKTNIDFFLNELSKVRNSYTINKNESHKKYVDLKNLCFDLIKFIFENKNYDIQYISSVINYMETNNIKTLNHNKIYENPQNIQDYGNSTNELIEFTANMVKLSELKNKGYLYSQLIIDFSTRYNNIYDSGLFIKKIYPILNENEKIVIFNKYIHAYLYSIIDNKIDFSPDEKSYCNISGIGRKLKYLEIDDLNTKLLQFFLNVENITKNKDYSFIMSINIFNTLSQNDIVNFILDNKNENTSSFINELVQNNRFKYCLNLFLNNTESNKSIPFILYYSNENQLIDCIKVLVQNGMELSHINSVLDNILNNFILNNNNENDKLKIESLLDKNNLIKSLQLNPLQINKKTKKISL